MTNTLASDRANSRTRKQGRFAEEARTSSELGLSNVRAHIGSPSPYSGEKVSGNAVIGDVVHYHDIANQNSNPQLVIDLPEVDKRYGWTGGYRLEDIETGEQHESDLRQVGWTFVEPIDDTTTTQESQYLDENGNRYGYCNNCGEEAMLDSECCINGEVVPHDDDLDINL